MIDKDTLSFVGLPCDPGASFEWISGVDAELQAIAAESIGWWPLEPGAYLHLGAVSDPEGQMTIEVVGSITADMASMNVLLVT